ncbi:phosphatase PAP2 family protein [Candidatus Gracilibacteria bacterium]|nr:phosphatase PAP2 family protein [Candidatus Gracilibacteria bacterium]
MKILPQKLSEINFSPLKRELWFWVGFGLFLYGVGKYTDNWTFHFFATHVRSPEIDYLIIFLTEKFIWGILILFILVTGYRLWTNPENQTKLLPAFFAIVTTGIMTFILKAFFGVPRPYMGTDLMPLVSAPSLSFPSAHAAISFALLIPFFRISKSIGWMWLIFSLGIGVARIYENVHYPSDIAGGIFLGGIIGSYFSHPSTKKMITLMWQELEFRRQSFHFIAGFLCVFAHWAGFFRLRWIATLLVLGLIISYLSVKQKLPVVYKILQLFDRPRDAGFPGKGAFYFLLGVFLTFLIFPVKIAYAAILILAVGDSLNHLFMSRVPSYLCFPWNRRKNCGGVAVGIVVGTFAAQFFVPIIPAFLASSFAIMSETIPFRFWKFYIDDNVFVPIIAGAILSGLS